MSWSVPLGSKSNELSSIRTLRPERGSLGKKARARNSPLAAPGTRAPAPTTSSRRPGWYGPGSEIVDTVDGGPDDDTGEVEFRAHFQGPSGDGVLHERSRFERRAHRWVYVEGDVE